MGVDRKCYTSAMRLFWWDLVKHVKAGQTKENPAPVVEEVVADDPVLEALQVCIEDIRKLRRDIDRIDRANYRAVEKTKPPDGAEVPLEVAQPAAETAPALATMRPGDYAPPGLFGGR